MIPMMRFLFIFCVYLAMVSWVHAYVPELVVQKDLHDIKPIVDPELSQLFAGELTGFPHTYEIRSEEPFTLYVEMRIPDLAEGKNNVSGIVIKEQRKGRVEEVTRFLAKDASWTVKDDTLIGDAYREGSSFEKELQGGVYRIEVSTPDNLETYMLRVGKREEMTIGYLELLGRIANMKKLYGKSAFFIIESPYVYWPLIALVLIVCGLWYAWYRNLIPGVRRRQEK